MSKKKRKRERRKFIQSSCLYKKKIPVYDRKKRILSIKKNKTKKHLSPLKLRCLCPAMHTHKRAKHAVFERALSKNKVFNQIAWKELVVSEFYFNF